MFEVTGDDVRLLDDEQLRTLVARLATAELQSLGYPISGITAGGDQNAPDGGIDVRVEVATDSFAGDFVPRVPVGFQVKKPDMGPAAIKAEMTPGDALREVIGELANNSGAYIIVSAQGSTADGALKNRRDAMRETVVGHPHGAKLLVDFYDRQRIASWVNKFPGVAAWVRQAVGRPLTGWQPMGRWSGRHVNGSGEFIVDDQATLIDARSTDQKTYSISEGLQKIRGELSEARTCIRIIGVSGLGKTRFVEALFEDAVGENALEPSLAVYTDYSEEPFPTAKQLAQSLTATGQRAILIIDNCNPQTHSDLAKICGDPASKVSLLTVEYDVRGDEPERTEVFRLQAASEKTIAKWIESSFPDVSQVGRDRIAEFSGGNFRVASVLAGTVAKGDTLANLKDSELFKRIFQQRNDPNEYLLRAAEALALVYSFDGEDTDEDSELAILSELAEIDANRLYEAASVLRSRAIIQARGRWRAVLPQAIANRLASQALNRLAPKRLDGFLAKLPERLARSFTRRLGLLHDVGDAQKAASRLLQPNGPLGDLLDLSHHALEMLRNLAPVAPEAVLTRIEHALSSVMGAAYLDPKFSERWQLAQLLRALAYDSALFDRSARALSKFVLAESPTENHNSARDSFEGLFSLYLSGTQAPPEQRRALIRSIFQGPPEELRCGYLALEGLLKSHHFSSSAHFDFGARPRDFGWEPETYGNIWKWYEEGLKLARELCSDSDRRDLIGPIIASELRGFAGIGSCLTQLEKIADIFLEDGAWVQGWRSLQMAIRFDGDKWLPEVKERASALEARLRPADMLGELQAWVLGGYSFLDIVLDDDDDAEEVSGYDRRMQRAADKARSLGEQFAVSDELLEQVLPDLIGSDSGDQVFEFGEGLFSGSDDKREMWSTLGTAFESADAEKRNASVLGGFISGAMSADAAFGSLLLEECLNDQALVERFVYLQCCAAIDESALERFERGIEAGKLQAGQFYQLANGRVRKISLDKLAQLLRKIASLEGGSTVALKIYHMAVYCQKSDGESADEDFLSLGRELLVQAELRRANDIDEHTIKKVIEFCYTGPGLDDEIRSLAQSVKTKIADGIIRSWEVEYIFNAIFEVQPRAALDEFLLCAEGEQDPFYGDFGLRQGSPLEQVPPEVLWNWADEEPGRRYPLVGTSLSLFPHRIRGETNEMSPLYLEALERSPDRSRFLAAGSDHLYPSGWSGSLALILEKRSQEIRKLEDHEDEAVKVWARANANSLQERASRERGREAEREESFE